MNVTVLGASGRTGGRLVEELLRRGHAVTAVVRDPAAAGLPAAVRVVRGDARDPAVLAEAVAGADAVASALGPRGRSAPVHRDMVAALIPAMRAAGVRRYVGVGGAGSDTPGDRKPRRDRVVSRLIHLVGGPLVADKEAELAAWRDSGLDWTVVRPPRLQDGEPTGRVEHDAHASTRSTRITRGDLAASVAEFLESGAYIGQAPFVATGGARTRGA